ncbi:solute-binding lipoprotein [[Clostridium] sordellii]|uniref:ABC transporter substrate-binding protein n=1 Tax=Paraclostridium sordellii TaxID=1505 RepID=UPI0005E77BD2|nr:ABC transporter substrate-binding protein [Paeniclostridium sordellii]MDU4412166.1 ABC transporter substrate-binding protein [Paeniclostridium sordellii]MRZ27903.1 ABC transporter substrate-binding protein [Paeniclostridium sordellii]CEN82816.1 solute-binding lipoprotein [[Clostridium] sordellii] [Paeniclostridium sordellii]CEO06762.1 solute-binding lipoprotein [[Clostridium] sordellii] [Paeniclostridium sordellii]CEO36371.1 solute-binding lipoprotein [[Clostridium] sordellii] [Paeniclostri
MKKIKILAIAMAVVFSIVGCSKDGKKDENNGKYENTANDSKYIHLSMINPKTINPINNTDQSVGYVMDLVYDSLFTIDSNYNAVPQLVESYSILGDGKSMEVKLKDAKWHNGNPITSSDVAFTVNSINSSQTSPYKALIGNISDISVIDSKNFRINFKSPNAFSIDTLIFPIVSKDALSGLSSKDLDEYKNNMVGSGPYKISKYDQRSNMILTLNEDYFDKDKIKGVKKEINVMMVPDAEAQVSMTLALSSDITKVGLSDLSQFQKNQFKITNYEGRGYEYIVFNYNKPIMKDLNFRKAIAHAINRKQIVDEGYLGKVAMVNFPLHSKSKYYDESIKALDYNMDKAKKYLTKIDIDKINNSATNNETKKEESSEKQDKKQQKTEETKETKETKEEKDAKNKNNIKDEIKRLDLKILVNKENSERVKAAYVIKENLNEIGIKSTISELEGTALSEALDKKDYDLALIGWEMSPIPDATDIINYSGYSDEKLTGYLNSLKNSTNVSNTKDIYKSIQKYTRDNVPFISIGISDDYLVTNKRIEGDLKPNDFDIYEGIYHLHLEK